MSTDFFDSKYVSGGTRTNLEESQDRGPVSTTPLEPDSKGSRNKELLSRVIDDAQMSMYGTSRPRRIKIRARLIPDD